MESSTNRGSRVDQLRQKVEQLITAHSRLAQQNSTLTEQLNRAQMQRRELQQQVIELERSLAISKIANTIVPHGAEPARSGVGGESVEQSEAKLAEKRQARKYINRLLREVDECIALLSTPLESGSKGSGSKERGNKERGSKESGNEERESKESGSEENY